MQAMRKKHCLAESLVCWNTYTWSFKFSASLLESWHGRKVEIRSDRRPASPAFGSVQVNLLAAWKWAMDSISHSCCCLTMCPAPLTVANVKFSLCCTTRPATWPANRCFWLEDQKKLWLRLVQIDASPDYRLLAWQNLILRCVMLHIWNSSKNRKDLCQNARLSRAFQCPGLSSWSTSCCQSQAQFHPASNQSWEGESDTGRYDRYDTKTACLLCKFCLFEPHKLRIWIERRSKPVYQALAKAKLW